MKFIKINGVYYNTMYIRAIAVVKSKELNYEAEVQIGFEGCAGERIGFKSMEDAEAFQNDILKQINRI